MIKGNPLVYITEIFDVFVFYRGRTPVYVFTYLRYLRSIYSGIVCSGIPETYVLSGVPGKYLYTRSIEETYVLSGVPD